MAYNLLKLRVDEISVHWGLVRQSILMSFPPGTSMNEETMANILQAAMEGRLQVWVLRDGIKPLTILTTVVTHDTISGSKTLFVYSLGALTETPLAAWEYGIKKLLEICKRVGCDRVLSRTNNQRLVKLLKRFGARADVHMLELEVSDG